MRLEKVDQNKVWRFITSNDLDLRGRTRDLTLPIHPLHLGPVTREIVKMSGPSEFCDFLSLVDRSQS